MASKATNISKRMKARKRLLLLVMDVVRVVRKKRRIKGRGEKGRREGKKREI